MKAITAKSHAIVLRLLREKQKLPQTKTVEFGKSKVLINPRLKDTKNKTGKDNEGIDLAKTSNKNIGPETKT